MHLLNCGSLCPFFHGFRIDLRGDGVGKGNDMLTQFSMRKNLQECRLIQCKLALYTVVSAVAGILVTSLAGAQYITLMRLAASRPVSIVGSVVTVLLPCIVSFYVVYSSKNSLGYLLYGLRIFTFTATGWALQSAFGSSGWLVRLMFQFPDICLIPLLILFLNQNIGGRRSFRHLVLCLGFIAFVSVLNYCAVSPFLASLIENYETMGRYCNSCWT